MAVKTKAQILSEISTLLADNTTGDISANDVRTVVNDITDSYENLITAGTTSQYLRGDKTWQTLPILELNGTLTAAQINALDTTPLVLLGLAGANKYYVVENASFHYKPLTVAFTGSFTLRVRYTLETARDIISNALDDSTLNTLDTAIRISNSSNNTYSDDIINQSVEIYSTAGISGGNGTINYSIKYRIVTTS